KNVFVLEGYIPERNAQALSSELSQKFEVAVELEEPSEDDDVPVLLENNGFSSPLEGTVESYSLPGKGEIDPTTMVSLFYYMLFGLMLSDAGYGAIIAIACGIGLLKFGKTMEAPMKKTLKMYLFCGLATVFWGIMFGSYFGDVIDVVSKTFFGKQITIPPLWFFPVKEPMKMMVFSLLIGIVHIFAGLGVKLYTCIKSKDYKGAIYDVVLWYTLIIGCVVILLSMKMVQGIFGLNFDIPQIVVTIFMIVAAASALGIILTSGRESRNPFKRILKGIYGLYGISGYLSDILSYSRLLALGLATGVIGSVINTMAAMPGNNIVGVIAFVVIFLFGHSVNLGINALGAYVHTNRLSYVEFFGKFYEGGGRKFNPFNTKTKFYKFRED
ncbi:MAG TPA: V-type ATPase 116kDa subunit family protein, partial [Oscillospiraceae bacterium]|nr:V-type ATPase 116kDa subunit family protein [Oscillospiraceae bacterium]